MSPSVGVVEIGDRRPVIGLPAPGEELVVADREIGAGPAPDALEGGPVVRRDREQQAVALPSVWLTMPFAVSTTRPLSVTNFAL